MIEGIMLIQDTQKALRRGKTAAALQQPLWDAPGAPSLLRGRVQELCGPARRSLAAMILGAHPPQTAPALWILPRWQSEKPHADGLADYTDPGRLLFAAAQRPADLLWAMEEALRAGSVSLVIADLPAPPGLTAIRRLQLATEAGAQGARQPPLGVILTPDQGGAPGVESRWHIGHRPGGWRLERVRARMEPPKTWLMERLDTGTGLCTAPQ
jgi:protein ImuA